MTKSIDLKRIEVITFDFWETLYNDIEIVEEKRNQSRLKLLHDFITGKKIQIDREKLENLYGRVKSILKEKSKRNTFKTFCIYDIVHQVIFNLKIDIISHYDEIDELIDNMDKLTLEYPPIINEDSFEVVKSLSERYLLAVISNTHQTRGRIIRKLLVKDNLFNEFSKFFFSDEVGVEKPNSYIFKQASMWFDKSPNQILHIGDSFEADYKGAIKSGLNPILVRNETVEGSENSIQTVKKLSELLNFL